MSLAQRRLVLALGVVASITWLLLAPSPRAARFAAIERLRESRQIGSLAPDDAAAFQSLVRKLLRVVGIRASPVINSAPHLGSLHFYVTEPSTRGVTGCDRGNAIYDPELDAVFIDRTLLKPEELSRLGGDWLGGTPNSGYPFTRTFVTLIILHELGHRQLHHGQRHAFDTGGSNGFANEQAADDFAVQSLLAAVRHGTFDLDADVRDELAIAGIGADLTPEQELMGAILYASSQMSVGLLFSHSALSSLYEDAAHPRFGQRIERIARTTAGIAESHAQLRAYLRYFRKVTGRIDALRQEHLREFYSETPVAATSFDEHGLVILDRAGELWHVPKEILRRVDGAEKTAASMQRIGQVPRTFVDPVDHLWCAAGYGAIIVSGHDAVRVRDGTTMPDRTMSGTHIPALAPEETSVQDSDGRLTVRRKDTVVGVLSWPAILRSAGAPQTLHARFDDFSVMQGRLRTIARDTDGSVLGHLLVDLTPPFRSTYAPLIVKGDVDAYGDVAIVGNRCFLVGKTSLDAPVQIWELSDHDPPLLRATYSPLLAGLSALPSSGMNVPVIVSRVQVDPVGFFVKLAGDSILRYDVARARLTPVFHPATSVNVDLSVEGFAAFSAYNGHKVFVWIPQ